MDESEMLNKGIFDKIAHKFGSTLRNDFDTICAEFSNRYQKTGAHGVAAWVASELLKDVAIAGLIVTSIIPPFIITSIIDQNATIYESQIEAYNENNQEYAKQFQNKNLSKFQIVMKAMDDMWSSIQGYGEPEIDALGFYELDIGKDGGVGKCRHMASDLAKKLNAIDPSFNARTVTVKMEDLRIDTVDDDYKTPTPENTTDGVDIIYAVNIDRNNLINDEDESKEDIVSKGIKQIVGNHEIVLFDDGDRIIAVDPTNLMVGTYRDGMIEMFNDTQSGRPVVFDPKEIFDTYMSIVTGKNGGIQDWQTSYYRGSNHSFEQLKKEMGTRAQMDALNYTRKIFGNTISKQLDETGDELSEIE